MSPKHGPRVVARGDKQTLPRMKLQNKTRAIIATLATGFALLLFVFIRQALRNASQDEESAQKITALKASWRKALGK